MKSKPVAQEVTLWTDAARAATLGQAVELMGSAVRPIAVGGQRVAAVDALARQLDCPFEDDFRKMLVERPAAFVMVATWRGLEMEDIQFAVDQGSTLLTLEPLATSLQSAAMKAGGQLLLIPVFDASRGWSAAAEPQQVIGVPRVVDITSEGSMQEWSLFARLHDAWRAVLAFTSLPQHIDASLTGPLSEPPEDPRALTGHLSIHARMGDRCAALLHVSDQSYRHARHLRVMGDEGTLTLSDQCYELRDPDGRLVDELANACDASESLADLIVVQWRRLLDQPHAPIAPQDRTAQQQARVLACCLATQLSARTGQPEDPSRLLQMHGVG